MEIFIKAIVLVFLIYVFFKNLRRPMMIAPALCWSFVAYCTINILWDSSWCWLIKYGIMAVPTYLAAKCIIMVFGRGYD